MIIKAEYISDYKLKITFNDGLVKNINLEKFVENSTHPLINKYIDKKLFEKVKVEDGTICWGNNEFDINPNNIRNGMYDTNL